MDPESSVLPETAPAPARVLDFSTTSVKNRIDRTFLEERASQTDRTVAKIKCFLDLDPESSEQ